MTEWLPIARDDQEPHRSASMTAHPTFTHRRIYSGGSMTGGYISAQYLNSSGEHLTLHQDRYRRDRNNVARAWELLAKTATLFDAGNPPLRPRQSAS